LLSAREVYKSRAQLSCCDWITWDAKGGMIPKLLEPNPVNDKW
jgi:hypothetical protein